jgi:Ribbon-helix-helix protein, copG family
MAKALPCPAVLNPVRGMRVRSRALPSPASPSVIPGYTKDMKTAISLPDDTYEQASRRAAELGISRSEFFARAARRYLDELASQSLTQQIDQALQAADDDSNAAAVVAGRSFLAAEDDW